MDFFKIFAKFIPIFSTKRMNEANFDDKLVLNVRQSMILQMVEDKYLNKGRLYEQYINLLYYFEYRLIQQYHQQMTPSNWAFKDGYEQSLLRSLHYFTIPSDPESQMSDYFAHLSISSDAHSPENHKQDTSVPPSQQPISQLENGTEFILPEQTDSTNLSIPELLESEEPSQAGNKATKRQNDNNNAHKPFITAFNKTLKDHKLLDVIKKELKKEGGKFEKGSRYSFIMRLIDAKMILAKKNQLDNLPSILNEYIQNIQNLFKLSKDPTPADRLKNSLITPYKDATNLFHEGKQIEATERIYDIQGAKQNKYKKEGIKKVEAYLTKRQSQEAKQ